MKWPSLSCTARTKIEAMGASRNSIRNSITTSSTPRAMKSSRDRPWLRVAATGPPGVSARALTGPPRPTMSGCPPRGPSAAAPCRPAPAWTARGGVASRNAAACKAEWRPRFWGQRSGDSRKRGDPRMSVIDSRVVNIDELKLEHFTKGEKYECDAVRIGPLLGAKDLGYSYDIVPPGKRSCPFHSHRGEEEMFFIVKGTGMLRYGDQTRKIRAGDVICCPIAGPGTRAQIVNEAG